MVRKQYRLVGRDGAEYLSPAKGRVGGHRRSRIYGRLDCPSASARDRQGRHLPEASRVFRRRGDRRGCRLSALRGYACGRNTKRGEPRGQKPRTDKGRASGARHCEGAKATEQSSFGASGLDCFAGARNDDLYSVVPEGRADGPPPERNHAPATRWPTRQATLTTHADISAATSIAFIAGSPEACFRHRLKNRPESMNETQVASSQSLPFRGFHISFTESGGDSFAHVFVR